MCAPHSMGVVFLLMSLVSLPTLLMFYTAETDAAEQFEKTGLVGFLGRTTMGQLGQGRTVCMEAGTSGEAHIDCGTGATIGLVEAYYGNPTGSCTCPVERRPVPDCPAVEDDGVCSPLDGFCFLGPRRSVCVCRCLGSCFEGSAYMFVSVFVCAGQHAVRSVFHRWALLLQLTEVQRPRLQRP